MARLHIQKVSVRLLLAIGILGMILDFYTLSYELCDIFRCFAISYKASWACPKGFVGCKGEEGGPHFISF